MLTYLRKSCSAACKPCRTQRLLSLCQRCSSKKTLLMRALVGIAWLFPAKTWPSDSMVLEIKQCMVDDRLRFSGFSPLVPCQQSHESAGAAVSKLMFAIQQGSIKKTKPLWRTKSCTADNGPIFGDFDFRLTGPGFREFEPVSGDRLGPRFRD